MNRIRYGLALALQFAATVAILGVVLVSSPELPPGETARQWLWLAQTGGLYAAAIWISLLVVPKEQATTGAGYYRILIWSLIILGGLEAIEGLGQLYGFAPSNHSLFSLTGTFWNPGPYSGYLALVFPLCLNEYLELKRLPSPALHLRILRYFPLAVLLLILCVLPAGMSRSAWLAAAASALFVCWRHFEWSIRLKACWQKRRKRMIAITTLASIALLLALSAMFYLKKDSANGRLFMWKMSVYAIAEKPLAGHGFGSFPSAYGDAQEAYFAAGHYSEQEELVAGSPEYAFNEYLQLAVEWGIPALLLVLAFVGFCVWRGMRSGRISACAGIISLAVFSFSSYPFEMPAFVVSFLFLLFACISGKRSGGLAVFPILIILFSLWLWRTDDYEACRKWAQTKVLYNVGSYKAAKKEYAALYAQLKNRAAFMFEYGHCLHKLEEADASIKILEEASHLSCDPMILNIIGKNYQMKGEYTQAERYFLRSADRLPGRIYPCYLLAKLYAEPAYFHADKLKEMAGRVLTKEPKVQSTAVREMREEVRKLLDLLVPVHSAP